MHIIGIASYVFTCFLQKFTSTFYHTSNTAISVSNSCTQVSKEIDEYCGADSSLNSTQMVGLSYSSVVPQVGRLSLRGTSSLLPE